MSGKWFQKYVAVCALFAVLLAAYFGWTAGNGLPQSAVGTAADPATFMTAEQLQHSAQYSAARYWMFFVSFPWEWGVLLWLLLRGSFRRWPQWLNGSDSGWLTAVRFSLYVLAIQAALFVGMLPLRLVSYSLARYYGVSAQPLMSWLQDRAISFALDFAVVAIAAATALWLIRRGGRWWLRLWLLSVPFTLLMMYIQPVLIDPLYTKFAPLSDSRLEDRILQAAEQAGIDAERVYVAEMSAKTNALNAYVNGIGPSLRIVLWDTTLQRLEEEETLFMMAHEIGHYKMKHLEWSAFGALAGSFVALWFGGGVLYPWALRRFGTVLRIESPHAPAALPLLLLLASLLSFISMPVSNAVSRQAESAADSYALELLGHADGAVSMYRKLAVASLSDVHPPYIVKLFRSTHPSLLERIERVERYEAGRD